MVRKSEDPRGTAAGLVRKITAAVNGGIVTVPHTIVRVSRSEQVAIFMSHYLNGP